VQKKSLPARKSNPVQQETAAKKNHTLTPTEQHETFAQPATATKGGWGDATPVTPRLGPYRDGFDH
jgi:hypothetical protein